MSHFCCELLCLGPAPDPPWFPLLCCFLFPILQRMFWEARGNLEPDPQFARPVPLRYDWAGGDSRALTAAGRGRGEQRSPGRLGTRPCRAPKPPRSCPLTTGGSPSCASATETQPRAQNPQRMKRRSVGIGTKFPGEAAPRPPAMHSVVGIRPKIPFCFVNAKKGKKMMKNQDFFLVLNPAPFTGAMVAARNEARTPSCPLACAAPAAGGLGAAPSAGVVQCGSAPTGSFPQRPPSAAWRLPHRCFQQRCCSLRSQRPRASGAAKPRALPAARTPSAVETPCHGHSVPRGGCPSPRALRVIAQGNVPGQIWP